MFETLIDPLRSEWEALLQLLIAALLGGVVGLERERRDKPAGFRTHLLICVGAALLTQISIRMAASATQAGGIQPDPGRIAAQIVSGIGFLGAGTIVQARTNVVLGLTTAASLWVVAAIGMAVGATHYVLAAAATTIVMTTLWLLGRLESAVRWGGVAARFLEVETEEEALSLDAISRILAEAHVQIQSTEVRRTKDGYVVRYATRATEHDRQAAVQQLMRSPGVSKTSVS